MRTKGTTIRGGAPAAPPGRAVDQLLMAGGGRAAPGATTGNAGADGVDETRQRILSTIDPFSSATLNDSLLAARAQSVANLYIGMTQLQGSLVHLGGILSSPTTPAQLVGVIKQPDGTPAAKTQLQFSPATLGSTKPSVNVRVNDDGSFILPIPQGLAIPPGGIPLVVHGGDGNVTVTIPGAQIGANGLVGTIMLPQPVQPLPGSILAALLNITAPTAQPADNIATIANPAQLPVVKVGEEDGCMLQFGANNSVDRFPFGVFFRLVEPRTSIVTQANRHPMNGNGKRFTFLPYYETAMLQTTPEAPAPADPTTDGNVTYVDRVPVEQPISVDGFRDRIMGLRSDGSFTGDETVPMAGTLGLGYILWMAQRWTFQGVSLGDLVYSLPLAPGEQEQVAIFERTDTSTVRETEFFSEEEAQQQLALRDTSTNATFNSAFNETINGSSSFHTDSSSSSWGGSLIIVSGGSGSSSSSGTSTQSLQGQRNTAQQAAESTHSAAQNQASARRSALRTGMRMATASESESVTTKVITNHNHTRALTLQYWEVLRLYDVATAIEGLTLACLVPMQIVRFLPPNQMLTLSDPSMVADRFSVLGRYGVIVRHADVLAQALPRKYQYGLTMLSQFAADPTANVEAFGGTAEDVIGFSLTGTFLPAEDIYISAVTRRGTRVGPVKLAPKTPITVPENTFTSRDDLVAWLRWQRLYSATSMDGALALPSSMNRGDIVGFEITRNFNPISYTLQAPEISAVNALNGIFGGSASWSNTAIQTLLGQGVTSTPRQSITLNNADLEQLGGPELYNFTAQIEEKNPDGTQVAGSKSETYANESLNGVTLPPQPYPVPALQLGPVLRYNEILEIEKMAQHVVRNTVTYSRAIWASMTPDERAIMLEAYTIGVPPDGIPDPSQMVPLLNCVENRVLGFYGNSMILPFNIPKALADAMTAAAGDGGRQTDFGQVEDSLLSYQIAGFKPPHSIVALPTHGVLGEAVLGHCPSAERIDLTRFWNWQDSPSDTAAQISPITLPTTTPSLTAGMTAPNSLTNLPSLINNVLTAGPPDTSLLQAMGKDAASQQDFSASLTGASQLADLVKNAQNTSNLARADALKTTKELNAQAMATVGNILGGIYGGNPEAGSKAAAAVNGSGSGTSGDSKASGSGNKPSGGTKSGGPTGGTDSGGTATGGTAGGTTGGTTGGGGGASGAPGPPGITPGFP